MSERRGAKGPSINGASKGDGVLAKAAADLSHEVQVFEGLTGRLERLELSSEEQIAKAAELLAEAARSHQRFLEVLRELVTGIEDARQRQNRSAADLSKREEALLERKRAYEALCERFDTLGEAVRALREVVSGEVLGSESDEEPPRDKVVEARSRLDDLVRAAEALAVDARQAGLSDLEQRGHAMFQGLQALARKLARLPS